MKHVIPIALVLFIFASSAIGRNLPTVREIRTEYKSFQSGNRDLPSKDVELYPNPVTEGRLTISASENIASVQILNITGKIIFNQEYNSNTNQVSLELDKLEKGVYLVRINFPGKEYVTEKIMVK